MSDEPRTDADAIVDIALAAAKPSVLDPDAAQVFVVPQGASLHLPDLSFWRDAPTRPTGIYKPATVGSFIDYVERHNSIGWTTVWVHPTSGRIVGVLDDNGPEGPQWGQHRAVLDLAPTAEWRYWLAHDGVMLSQEQFAEHIEGGLEEIAEPDAATMLEIAQTFHATSSAQFRSSTRLVSGEQRLQYDEEIQAAAGTAGDMTVPTRLLLAVAPFIGEERYRVAARLRFRLQAGRLTLGYKLDRPDAVVRDALEGIAERLGEKFPDTFVGEPAD